MPRDTKPADWSGDDEIKKRERKAYWQTGWATGPDTVMGAVWATGLIAAAASDSYCWPSGGLSSGADGATCTDIEDWNQTLFTDVGGESCSDEDVFGVPRYYHDPDKAGCMAAFAAYRAVTAYTCNCSGYNSPHAFLGSDSKGFRPSIIYTQAFAIGVLIVAIMQFFIGTFSDFSQRRLKVWWIMTFFLFGGTMGMAVVGPGSVWVIGLIFSVLTIIFSEISLPIRAQYMEDVSDDLATAGYLGAMRQVTSYVSQLLFAIIYTGLTLVGLKDWTISTIMAVAASVWFIIFMSLILRKFTEHGAKRTNDTGKGLCSVVMSETCADIASLKKYPEACKLLALSSILQVGGPVIVAISAAYATDYLQMPPFLYGLVVLMVLLMGAPAAYLLAKMRKNDTLSFRAAWAIDISLFFLISVVIPLTANSPDAKSWYITIALAGMLGGIALSWFYSLGWASFSMLIPEQHVGSYAGIFQAINTIFAFIGPQIYVVVVQASSSHVLGWATTAIWVVIAFIILFFIDFEKGFNDTHPSKATVVDPSHAASVA